VVLVVGHSNTIPELLRALGCAETIALGSNEYDALFLVVPTTGESATLIRLRY
jgi:hypothetical protein